MAQAPQMMDGCWNIKGSFLRGKKHCLNVLKKSRHCEGDTLYKSRGAIMVKMLTMVVFLSVAVSHNAEVLVLSV